MISLGLYTLPDCLNLILKYSEHGSRANAVLFTLVIQPKEAEFLYASPQTRLKLGQVKVTR